MLLMFSVKNILVLTAFTLSFSAQAKLEFDPKAPLYTADGTKFGFDQIHEALDLVFSSQKPVVIYIHGRGDEPLKSIVGKPFIGGASVPQLEKDFAVRVLLFNWDSQGVFLDRTQPLSKIPSAVESFKRLIAAIKTYDLTGKKLILHAHSMGSIVLQNYILQNGWVTSGQPLFANVLFTEPDADNLDHFFWMEQISLKENVFITINHDDLILSRSTDERPTQVSALGLNPTAPLSKAATYLDFTKMGDQVNKATHVHEIFDKASMKFQTQVCSVIQDIMQGQKPALRNLLRDPLQNNYFKFRFAVDQNDSCFKKRMPSSTDF